MDEYFEANRKRWDEAAGVHANSTAGYRIADFCAGEDTLLPIERAEVGDVVGKRLVHLQCHIGTDTLNLARRGAEVTGLDFSARAIAEARALSERSGVSGTFVEGNLYDAPDLIDGRFDIAYVTWGAINWLPDIRRWAEIVAHLLVPGGYLYLLEGHPGTLSLDQAEDGRLVPSYPYFQGREPIAFDDETSYSGDQHVFEHTRAYEWNHPIGAIVTGLIDAGLTIDFLHEHDSAAWKPFPCMVEADQPRMYTLPPDVPPLPLAFSLKASKR